MKKLMFFVLLIFTLKVTAQESLIVELPETYELSNIILAMTKYGQSDKLEVQKNSAYYREILDYFEPVKNHPLLDSVNYSRAKWDYYLSFRTDAYAYTFDATGKLKRVNDFYSMDELKPFDTHLALINDFVTKSKFRQFYQQHQTFYNYIINNYKTYFHVAASFTFLNERIGKPANFNSNQKYIVVLSPLVYRMNCHRDIDDQTVADFPSASEDFINGITSGNPISRVVQSHNLFTEADHGYINPISDKYEKLITQSFDTKKWDMESGYEGISVFNEYMTWAVYDLFIKEYFPDKADSIAIQWQYQNADRGFWAQNIFANKMVELYYKKGQKKFESIYVPFLKWCKKAGPNITQPTMVGTDPEHFVKVDLNRLELNFSEPMNTKLPIDVQIFEFKNEKATGNKKIITLKGHQWSNQGKTLSFKIDTPFEEFVLKFNWWGNGKPLVSKNGIFLAPGSSVALKK